MPDDPRIFASIRGRAVSLRLVEQLYRGFSRMLADEQQRILMAWSSTTSSRGMPDDPRIFVSIRGRAVSFRLVEQLDRGFSRMLVNEQQLLLMAWSSTTSSRGMPDDQRIFASIRGRPVSLRLVEQLYRGFSRMLADEQQLLLMAGSSTTSSRGMPDDPRIFASIRGRPVSFRLVEQLYRGFSRMLADEQQQ